MFEIGWELGREEGVRIQTDGGIGNTNKILKLKGCFSRRAKRSFGGLGGGGISCSILSHWCVFLKRGLLQGCPVFVGKMAGSV